MQPAHDLHPQHKGPPGDVVDEFLLRYIMKGTEQIEAMRAVGPHRQYLTSALPIATLLEELGRHKSVRYVHVQRGTDSLLIQGQAAH